MRWSVEKVLARTYPDALAGIDDPVAAVRQLHHKRTIIWYSRRLA
jgi:hypothetical protein